MKLDSAETFHNGPSIYGLLTNCLSNPVFPDRVLFSFGMHIAHTNGCYVGQIEEHQRAI
jgi:hypothetical protein